jgi:hypothetical protein
LLSQAVHAGGPLLPVFFAAVSVSLVGFSWIDGFLVNQSTALTSRGTIVPVDKFRWRLNSAGMLRKFLAVVLAPSWLLLSGLDVLEGWDIQSQSEIYGAKTVAASGSAPLSRWANNIVETADDSEPRESAAIDLPLARQPAKVRDAFLKAARLHKLHRVFLI